MCLNPDLCKYMIYAFMHEIRSLLIIKQKIFIISSIIIIIIIKVTLIRSNLNAKVNFQSYLFSDYLNE